MNKAVIYISGTMNETVDNMVVRVIERYCEILKKQLHIQLLFHYRLT